MGPTIKAFFTDKTVFARACRVLLSLIPLAVSGLTGLLTPEHMHTLFILSSIFNALALAIPAGQKNSDPAHPGHQAEEEIVVAPRGFATLRVLLGMLFSVIAISAVLAGCSFLTNTKSNIVACAEADPGLETQVLNALAEAAEEQWMAAVVALVPDPELRKCILAGILSAASTAPDGGNNFTYVLSDGGVVSPQRLTSAKQLGESDQQRVARRAQTYFALTK